jgi:hypothetical protein
MAYLTSREALQLAADFALKAEYMRADTAVGFQTRADLYETASRVAFLKARVIAKDEALRPVVRDIFRRAPLVVG